MVKKNVAKKSVRKKSSYMRKSPRQRETEKLLVENFVSLQKVMVNLSGRLDKLTREISELLKLFEDSAKVIVKNEIEKKKEDRGDQQLLDTLVSILDQNKVIAKGLTLMYETMTDSAVSHKPSFQPVKKIAPLEKKQMIKEENEYSSSREAVSRNSFPVER